MALLKAKQLDINTVTQSVLQTISNNYGYDLTFSNLVRAVNVFSTGYTYPSPVLNIQISNVTANSAVISWSPVGSATSYDIQFNPVADPYDSTIILGITTSFYTITGLLQDTVYEIKVRPVV